MPPERFVRLPNICSMLEQMGKLSPGGFDNIALFGVLLRSSLIPDQPEHQARHGVQGRCGAPIAMAITSKVNGGRSA
jgi:hypothetical protein